MANLSQLEPNKNLKCLVYGDSGNGKTIFATSFPGKMFVADFDNKIASAAGFLGKKNPAKLEQIDYENFAEDPSHPDHYSRFYTKLVELEKVARAGGEFPYRTFVLDSLTTYADAILKEVVKQNPGIKGAAPGLPGLQHYGIMNMKFKEHLGRMLALPCNVVVTAHIEITKDEVSGEILRRPLLTGKLSVYLPIVFGEVYRAFTEQKDGKSIYQAQTRSDGKFSCRSQIAGLPDRVPLDYESIVRAY